MRATPVVSFLGCALAVLTGAAACTAPAPQEPTEAEDRRPATLEVRSGDSFTLMPGGSARIADADLTVRFLEVESDSRCPIEVDCVWAGDAVLVIETVSGSATRVRRLHTPTEMVGPGSVALNGHVLHVLVLEPAPRERESTPQEDYRATFRVDGAEPSG